MANQPLLNPNSYPPEVRCPSKEEADKIIDALRKQQTIHKASPEKRVNFFKRFIRDAYKKRFNKPTTILPECNSDTNSSDIYIFDDFLKQISDENLRLAVTEALNNAPDYFWEVPASSTGKYHPITDAGEGGLTRHVYMTIRCGLDLLRSEIFIQDTAENRDSVIVACLFHDIVKNGIVNSGHTTHEHPIDSANFLEGQLSGKMPKKQLDEILEAIRRHMGIWTTSSYSPMILNKPETEFQKLVATADYMASRKYCLYEKSKRVTSRKANYE